MDDSRRIFERLSLALKSALEVRREHPKRASCPHCGRPVRVLILTSDDPLPELVFGNDDEIHPCFLGDLPEDLLSIDLGGSGQ